ncbi:MAG: hypothetical protein IPL32_19745 [Chloracidobacterium sp.]|nr:hypothetical protein [Chloracidobacterium sp.]
MDRLHGGRVSMLGNEGADSVIGAVDLLNHQQLPASILGFIAHGPPGQGGVNARIERRRFAE